MAKSDEELTEELYAAIKVAAKKQSASLDTYNSDEKGAVEDSVVEEGRYEYIQADAYDAYNRRVDAEITTVEEGNKDRIHSRELRDKYARSVFRYLVCYSSFVAIVLLMSGCRFYGFRLDDGVLQFLSGSTAVAAIGLVYAVTHGLFGGIGKR